MSQENVELFRRYDAALRALGEKAAESSGRRLDAVDLAEAAALVEEYWHPQAVVDGSRLLDGAVYHGRAGVLELARQWFAVWRDFDTEIKELLPVGDRLIVVRDQRAIGEGGIEVESHGFCPVYTIRDGQFVHYEEYPSRAEALEAVGLRA